jgi:hypothetical protein
MISLPAKSGQDAGEDGGFMAILSVFAQACNTIQSFVTKPHNTSKCDFTADPYALIKVSYSFPPVEYFVFGKYTGDLNSSLVTICVFD